MQRVAVIAIHGVGDHPPQEMAKAVGGLLESRVTGGEPRYTAFESDSVRTRIGPVKLKPKRGFAPEGKGAWGPLDAMRMAGATVQPASAAQKDSIDHVFMEGQLSGYEGRGPEDTYDFYRLESVRKAAAGFAEKRVHVYDMFWSDLSGVGQVGLRIFGELYQILFHLGSVGVNNVAAAAAFLHGKAGVDDKWNAFAKAQKFAAGMLAFPIALLNLVLLIVSMTVFATGLFSKMSPLQQWIAATVAVVAIIASAWAWRRLRSGRFSRAPLFFAMVAALLAAGGVALLQARWTTRPPATREYAQAIAATLILTVFIAAGAAIVSQYDKRRPGAFKAFWIALAAVLLSAALSLPSSAPWVARYAAMAILVRVAELGFCWLALSWLAFWVCMLWALFAGRSAVRAVKTSTLPGMSNEADRAGRTNWTARLTLGLPAAIFLMVTFAAWAGLLNAALPLLPRDPSLAPDRHPARAQVLAECQTSTVTFCYAPLLHGRRPFQPARTWADEAFFKAGVPVLPILLALTAIAALIAIYATAPSVADETVPPKNPTAADALALGTWLDHGTDFMRWAGRCIYLGVFLFPPLLVAFYFHPEWLEGYIKATLPFSKTMGTLVAGSAVGALAFGGRLSKLALGLRTGVRVALDVDNWLREHPRGTNPTARICARYVSLLRYIAAWRDSDNRPYDALVIFAHSQGTVITADLLRFLTVEARAAGGYSHYDASLQDLARMRVYLFTAGCPLRQLYGLRFPYFYGYAAHDASGGPPPEPSDLGVTLWTNGYRTGDYVGRDLWRPAGPVSRFTPAAPITPDAWNPPVSVPDNVFTTALRAEFAVGAGAHTHYWDHTADQVAEALDGIIARA